MIIKVIPTGSYQSNTYLVMDEETKEGFIVDNHSEGNRIMEEINTMGMKPKAILLTHGHFDHVTGIDYLREALNIPVYLNENDWNMIENKDEIFGDMKKPEFFVKEGDTITIGKKEILVIETPGHTPGGVCFLVDGHLFTGDTLFQGSIGRTDFVGGNSAELLKSIKDKLTVLKDETKVYPGHGPSSTIGREKMTNPYMAGADYVY